MSSSSGALLHAAYLLTTDRGHAQDLVQDTYARVAQHWPRLERQGGDPTAYARVVLYRLAIDRWRARARRSERLVDDVTSVDRGATTVSGVEDRILLEAALARLTPRQRAVLVLRYAEDRSEADTAAVLGCSVNTVKSQTRHPLARLRVLAPDLLAEFAPALESREG
ncbi:MAG: sigma-70 family RNA polymerase sigma factor [Tetrasphaera sp.]